MLEGRMYVGKTKLCNSIGLQVILGYNRTLDPPSGRPTLRSRPPSTSPLPRPRPGGWVVVSGSSLRAVISQLLTQKEQPDSHSRCDPSVMENGSCGPVTGDLLPPAAQPEENRESNSVSTTGRAHEGPPPSTLPACSLIATEVLDHLMKTSDPQNILLASNEPDPQNPPDDFKGAEECLHGEDTTLVSSPKLEKDVLNGDQ
ncbi:unnamed protein product [Boreogadus saida]